MPMLRRSAILTLLLALGACAAPQTVAPPATPRAAPPPPQSSQAVSSLTGLTGRRLQAMFGRPRLEIEEGHARKLQFAGEACVLDAYLYPPAQGQEPVVTHVDARLGDGRDYDAASCIAALTQPSP